MAFTGFTNEGAELSIGTSTPATTAVQFAADVYEAVGTFEQLPEIGQVSNVATANPVNGDEISRKGSRRFPESSMTLLYEPASAGLVDLQAAELSDDEFNFKIEYPDLGATEANGTTHYFRALVTGISYPSGGVDDFARVSVAMKMTSRVVVEAAA